MGMNDGFESVREEEEEETICTNGNKVRGEIKSCRCSNFGGSEGVVGDGRGDAPRETRGRRRR